MLLHTYMKLNKKSTKKHDCKIRSPFEWLVQTSTAWHTNKPTEKTRAQIPLTAPRQQSFSLVSSPKQRASRNNSLSIPTHSQLHIMYSVFQQGLPKCNFKLITVSLLNQSSNRVWTGEVIDPHFFENEVVRQVVCTLFSLSTYTHSYIHTYWSNRKTLIQSNRFYLTIWKTGHLGRCYTQPTIVSVGLAYENHTHPTKYDLFN